METLTNDPRFFVQTTSFPRVKSQVDWANANIRDYVIKTVSSILGSDFEFNSPTIIDDSEPTGLTVYDILTTILPPRSPQCTFFWRKIGRSFASMMETAEFPLSSQISFLIFVYARLLGMMGPLDASGSLMTFDGSPVELSWVIPRKGKSSHSRANRQLRFAIEPIDPRSGQLLSGAAVMRYLTSINGSLGIVECEEQGMDWSNMTHKFLFPDGEEEEINSGSRFFVGFDFAPSGSILLKTYYLPGPRRPLVPSTRNSSIKLWDADYTPLRDLLSCLDPSLYPSLDMLTSYVHDLDVRLKPRIQILSMDCVANDANRLKLYCRPSQGNSWSDAKRAFTLGGRLSSPEMKPALDRLEALWNLLFPFANSHSNRDLDEALRPESEHGDDEAPRNPEHPSSGLLYYYSLVPGNRMILPKIYIPVARYCKNDAVIAQAMEQFHALDGRSRGLGWVSQEVSAAYNHRDLSERSGIHTYITFALKKNYDWEITSYFSPEVWDV